MRYTVTWKRAAELALTEIWLESTDRRTVTRLINQVDSVLKNRPEEVGEEFYGDRLLVLPPLHVVYAVNQIDRHVQIQQVWVA